MNLLVLLVVVAVSWLAIQFFFLPRAEKGGASVARAGTIAFLRYVRFFLFVALCTYAAVAIVIKLFGLGGDSVIWVSDKAQSLHLWLQSGLERPWSLLIMLVLFVGLAQTFSKRERKAAVAARDAYMEAEWEKIDAQREAGTLEDLPRTSKMTQIQELIDQREALLLLPNRDEIAVKHGLDLENVAKEAVALHKAYYAEDTLRRIPEQPIPPAPKKSILQTLRDQVGTVLASRGTVAVADSGRRSIHLALTVLLCLSIVTVVADSPLATALRSEAIHLAEVRVQSQHQASARAFAEALPPQTLATPRALTPSETAGIREFSNAFVQALDHSRALGSVQLPDHDFATVHNAHVRAQILAQLQNQPVSLADVQSLDGASHATAARIDGGGTYPHDPIVIPAETELAQRLSRVPQAESENFLRRIRRAFVTPSDAADVLAAIRAQGFETFSNVAFGGGSASAADELASALGDSGSDAFEQYGSALRTWMQTRFENMTVAAARSDSAISMSRVADADTQTDRFGQALLRDISQNYTSEAGWDRLVSETTVHPPAAPPREPAIPQWAIDDPPGGDSAFATTFADIAPAGLGDDLRSPRNSIELAQQRLSDPNWQAPAIPSVTDPAPPDVVADISNAAVNGADAVVNDAAAIDEEAGFLRAGSYELLSGFSRIGGVLIGAMPANRQSVDCRGLDWIVSGDTVVLSLSGPNCPWHGQPLDRATVAKALAYAADGRPVATTMVSSSPLLDGLSVHPHPALVDSLVGREASKIDMFIDTYYRGDTAHPPDRAYTLGAAEIDGQIALYHTALGIREELLEDKAASLDAGFGQYVRREAGEIAEQIGDNTIGSGLASHRAFASQSQRQSILRAKAVYFDPDLAEIVEACESRLSPDSYRSCARSKAQSDIDEHGDDDDQVKHWFEAHVVQYHIESGVRETPYATTDALRVSDDATASDRGIGPFRFEVHVTFYTSPAYGAGTADEIKQDEHPYDLPEAEAGIRRRIEDVGKTHADVDRTLHRMAAFTRAQRLFRLALAGELGPQFPIDRLSALAKAVSEKPIARPRTMRWLAHPFSYLRAVPGYRKQLDAVAAGGSRAASTAARMSDALSTCAARAFAGFRTTQHLVFDDPSCRYGSFENAIAHLSSCDSDDCNMLRETIDFFKILRLRKDLGVAVDDPDQFTPDDFFPS